MLERRGRARFKLSLPVTLNHEATTTRDISSSGIFFETAAAYSVGDVITVSLKVQDATVQCVGHVVRVETLDNGLGIAVEFNELQFSMSYV